MTDLEVVLSQIESLESEREKLRRDSVHAAKDRWLAELEHELAALRSKADALRKRSTSTASRRGGIQEWIGRQAWRERRFMKLTRTAVHATHSWVNNDRALADFTAALETGA